MNERTQPTAAKDVALHLSRSPNSVNEIELDQHYKTNEVDSVSSAEYRHPVKHSFAATVVKSDPSQTSISNPAQVQRKSSYMPILTILILMALAHAVDFALQLNTTYMSRYIGRHMGYALGSIAVFFPTFIIMCMILLSASFTSNSYMPNEV